MAEQVTLKTDDVSITLPAPKQIASADDTEFRFYGMTEAQKEMLAAFFMDVVKGTSGRWTYVDPRGRSFPAQFAESMLVFVKFEGAWDISTLLLMGKTCQACGAAFGHRLGKDGHKRVCYSCLFKGGYGDGVAPDEAEQRVLATAKRRSTEDA